jgi:hypothetical protein
VHRDCALQDSIFKCPTCGVEVKDICSATNDAISGARMDDLHRLAQCIMPGYARRMNMCIFASTDTKLACIRLMDIHGPYLTQEDYGRILVAAVTGKADMALIREILNRGTFLDDDLGEALVYVATRADAEELVPELLLRHPSVCFRLIAAANASFSENLDLATQLMPTEFSKKDLACAIQTANELDMSDLIETLQRFISLAK